MNLVTGVLLLAIFLLYGTGVLLMGVRIRLDTYISLLQASMEGDIGADAAHRPS